MSTITITLQIPEILYIPENFRARIVEADFRQGLNL